MAGIIMTLFAVFITRLSAHGTSDLRRASNVISESIGNNKCTSSTLLRHAIDSN